MLVLQNLLTWLAATGGRGSSDAASSLWSSSSSSSSSSPAALSAGSDGWKPTFSAHDLSVARSVLSKHPLIDLHVDLPVLARFGYSNAVPELLDAYRNGTLRGQVDLKRLREGKAGGIVSAAYVPCPDDLLDNGSAGEDFTGATHSVRDTLEQIDVTQSLVAWNHKDLALAASAEEVRRNFAQGKISHIVGMEGGHMLGNSLGALRQYAKLGTSYLTLTHTCHNAFADSASPAEPLHNGLSEFGRDALIPELNRLGILVDVSHTSNATAAQAIRASRAPVIFSHSSSRALFNHPRNVEDSVLRLFDEPNPHYKHRHGRLAGRRPRAPDEEGELYDVESTPDWATRDGLVGATAVPYFLADESTPTPTVETVADHVEHLAAVVGRHRVALGTDMDGFVQQPPAGLADARDYPNLLAVLHSRGWSRKELADLAGGNFLRIWRKAELVARRMQHEGVVPSTAVYDKRPDLGSGKTWKMKPAS